MAEGLDRQRGPKSGRHLAVLVERGQHRVVARRRRDDRDVRVVLGRRPDHRRPADVDLLDELVEADPGPLRGGRERVEVDDDQLEGGDRRGEELAAMVGETTVRQDSGVDPRVERLHPPVEHLGKPVTAATSVTGRPASRSARAVPPVDTSSNPRATRPRPKSARPALSETDSSARRGAGTRASARPGRSGRPAGRARPVSAPASSAATGAGSSRCSTGVDPRQQRRLVVAGQDRHGLLRDDRPAVERRVHEMDRAAGDGHARGQRVATAWRRERTAAATGAC